MIFMVKKSDIKNVIFFFPSIVPQENRFGLDDDSEASISIPLVSLTEASVKDKKSQKQKTRWSNHDFLKINFDAEKILKGD